MTDTPEQDRPQAAHTLDIVKTIFRQRLRQADLERILGSLKAAERDELVAKFGDLLERISALIEVYNKVSDTLSLDVMLPRLMGIVTETLHADRSTLFLNDPDTGELFSRVAQGDAIGEIRFPNRLGIAGSVFTSGEGVIIPDAYADPRFNQDVDRRTGYKTRNILCAPLRSKGVVIGVTQVLNKKETAFTTDDLDLLEALTAQAASALENARLFEKVEKARREEAKLLEVTTAIASELRLDVLLGRIVAVTTEMLDADRSTLFVHDPKTGLLWSRVAEGLAPRDIHIPAGAGIAGACFTSGEAVNIPDAYADPRFNQAVDRKTGYRTRNILAMPVINKEGRCLGVLQVLNKRSGPFAQQDERRLKAFGAQAAIALENARLFADVTNERNYNEAILHSMSNGVVTLDADRAVAKVNEAALRIMRWDAGQVLGRPFADLFMGERNAWLTQALERVSSTGRTDTAMDIEIDARGETISANTTLVQLIGVEDEPLGFMLVIEDISSEKRVKSTMARYMTKEVADRLLTDGADALGGQSQVATVLFSDIRSFTTLSEALGARGTVSMLNEYFTEMVDVIFERKGILDKYIGDAIMAIFGSPFPGPEDADNALKAANDMVRVLRFFNARRRGLGLAEIRIGVGLTTGELVAGNIGSPKRMDYTVIGDTVNLASRLEGATKYYGVEVLVSEATVDKLHDDYLLRELDLIRVKGKNRPVAIYESLDHYPAESRHALERALLAYRKGLLLYRSRDWDGAAEAFEAALAEHPGDGPSAMYLDRCKLYISAPPEPHWDGVWTMTTK
ncbi:MAG: GAF domain-containing protein [Elusimicrobia bacterium]|nr:GAF domain-containing protein [Elusimicrobiota bacterium]